MGKSWDGADIEKVAKQSQRKNQKTRMCSDGKIRKSGENILSIAAGKYDQSLTGNKAFEVWTWQWAQEVYRVLKPGAYILVFCGPRTYHRMACGIEDAGFEIRDQLQWLYGSGFPKSHNISKGIDKKYGAEREVVGKSNLHSGQAFRTDKGWNSNNLKPCEEVMITAPSTSQAKQWDGWGTALKPSNEPIVLARKPLSEKTVVDNVLKWGCGGLNIDGCRIGTIEKISYGKTKDKAPDPNCYGKYNLRSGEGAHSQGRWPANTLFDYAASQMLDEQSGILKQGGAQRGSIIKSKGGGYNAGIGKVEKTTGINETDTYGASRFFYVAKASKRERNEGLEGMPEKRKSHMQTKNGTGERSMTEGFPDTFQQNHHPTVKPIKLMQYLVRLITPPKGIVLDPFMGSGTTGIAALNSGFEFCGIELNKEYLEIARKRISQRRQHVDDNFVQRTTSENR